MRACQSKQFTTRSELAQPEHSITDGGVNSLVGVAISASLLPPIVNAGMCLSWGMLLRFSADKRYERQSGTHLLKHTFYMSFILFLLNVVCIYLTGLGVFKFKEISRMVRSRFWSDLPTILQTSRIDRGMAFQVLIERFRHHRVLCLRVLLRFRASGCFGHVWCVDEDRSGTRLSFFGLWVLDTVLSFSNLSHFCLLVSLVPLRNTEARFFLREEMREAMEMLQKKL
jgi:hypothetical protein